MTQTNYDLEDIKKHPAFPFADFEDNPLSFLMLELYWAELFRSVLGSQVQNWRPSDMAQPDGNPIFSAVHAHNGRSVRVVQKRNDEGKPSYPSAVGIGAHYPFQAWLNAQTPAPPASSTDDRFELVIFADISDEAEKQTRHFTQLYCIEGLSSDDLEKAIVAYEDKVAMPD